MFIDLKMIDVVYLSERARSGDVLITCTYTVSSTMRRRKIDGASESLSRSRSMAKGVSA
ncbi:MAG: hypothetical protein ACLRSW_05500 [Christensenellaceae bacterium]